MKNTGKVEIEVTIKTSTDKALLVFDGVREAWIPISQISDWSGCDFEDTLLAKCTILIPVVNIWKLPGFVNPLFWCFGYGL
jgi:hypothetical protein